MTVESLFSKISGWLQSTELFERPRKKILGKWQLFEYFVDKENELLHFTEEDLKAGNQSFEIDFTTAGTFTLMSTVPIKRIEHVRNGTWSISRNFVALMHPDNFRESIEFQFAFEKQFLKMLKKDAQGNIEFFGLFRKLESDC